MAVFQTLLAQMSEKSDGKFTLPSASPSSSSSSSSSFSSSTSSSPSFNASAPVPAAPGAYKEPFWSAVPQENYGLEVIKEGTIVETIDLSRKPYYVFGRLPNNDVTILHPSLSRRHAVIQHRDTGQVLIRDLRSTHGVKVNKQAVDSDSYLELKVGDVIQFGASTRKYCLTGPVSAEETRKKGPRIKFVPKFVPDSQRRRKQEEEEEVDGVDWGLGSELALLREMKEKEERETEAMETIAGLKNKKLNDNQQKRLESIERKRLKATNLRSEFDILKNKQSSQGELSQGQAHRMAQLETHMTKIQDEVEAEEFTLMESIRDGDRQRQLRKDKAKGRKGRKGGKDEDEYAYNSDEDDFYDRTKAYELKKKARLAGKTLAEEEALLGLQKDREARAKEQGEREKAGKKKKKKKTKGRKGDDQDDDEAVAKPGGGGQATAALAEAKLKLVQLDVQGMEERITKLMLQLEHIDERATGHGGEGGKDELDSYMAGIAQTIQKDKRKKTQRELERARAELGRLREAESEQRAKLLALSFREGGSKVFAQTAVASGGGMVVGPARPAAKDRKPEVRPLNSTLAALRKGKQRLEKVEQEVTAAQQAKMDEMHKAEEAKQDKEKVAAVNRLKALAIELGDEEGKKKMEELEKSKKFALEQAAKKKEEKGAKYNGKHAGLIIMRGGLQKKDKRRRMENEDAFFEQDEEPAKRPKGPLDQSLYRGFGGYDVEEPQFTKGKAYDADKAEPVWVPPSNQTGDGKTSLNAKFGY